MNLLSLLTGIAVIGASVLAMEGVNQLTGGEFYLSSVSHLAQESAQSAAATVESHPPTTSSESAPAPAPQPMPTQPATEGKPGSTITEEEAPQEFIDPRQIQDGIRNINQFRNEIKRTIKEIKKQASANDLNELTQVQSEVDKLYTAARSSNLEEANDAVREFYDNQYWEKINNVRARLQIPKEIKQINQSVKRLEKILQTKSIQNIGLDIAKAQQTLAEMKQAAETVQNLYNGGNYQEAQEEMRLFHEGGHPGEIEGVIFRIRDIKNMAKRVKDEAVRAEVDCVLQEVIDAFNAGEYRDARETMDEYADDLQRLISQLVQAQSRRGYNRRDSSTKVQSLGDLIAKKLQEAENNQGQQTFPSNK